MNRRLFVMVTMAAGLAVGWNGRVHADSVPAGEDAKLEFFEKKVRPILVDNCYNCHSANTNAKGGLRVDDRNGLLQGGNARPGGRPGQSRRRAC